MEKEANFMPLKFKIDVLEALKEKNITTYSLRKDKLLSESTIQKLREGKGVSWDSLEVICKLLGCQPADLIEYVEDAE
jgi:putative transcriptional regulator